ncbi:MAG TPA: hypothetical protein VLN49_23925 [Gemmatimonadaceae bacterium]|nr:hypothetical protein [Gemmatimonadaceae bacterium]
MFAAISQASSPGWVYATTFAYDSGDGAHHGSVAVRFQATDRASRMQYMHMDGSTMANATSLEGSYVLTNRADSTTVMVIPGQHLATIMAGPMLSLSRPLKPQLSQHLANENVEDLGSGERVLDHATQRYRLTRRGTMEIKLGDQSCTQSIDDITDVWIAPDVDLAPAMQMAFGQTGAAIDELLKRDAPSKLPKGAVLRAITKSALPDARDGSRTITTTVELTELSQVSLDSSLFVVPDGYRTIDMRQTLAHAPPAMLDQAAKLMLAKMCGGATKP